MFDKEKAIKTLNMIAQDMKDDVSKLDGLPFTGRTVREYFGSQAAAIVALALVLKWLIDQGEDA